MEFSKVFLKKFNCLKIIIGNDLEEDTGHVIGSVELDIENQVEFVDFFNHCFVTDLKIILIDLINVNYIDSSGLWALFETYKKSFDQDVSFALLNPNKDVKRVLLITKMASKMSIFDSEDAALDSLI